MKFFVLAFLLALAQAVPLYKRLYQPTSPMVSLIAKGVDNDLNHELVKFDGENLRLLTADDAFFGRIKASVGYVLNIPGNSTSIPSTQNVHITDDGQLSSTGSGKDSAPEFGIKKSLLNIKDSEKFLACPNLDKDDKWDSEKWHEYEYSLYQGDKKCPGDAKGLEVNLQVQLDSTVNYNSETNVQKFRRWVSGIWA
ncbi:hypothetical protein DICA0_F14290 [Diutina catenulata]